MSSSLVRHAHPHSHVLIKLEGPDQSFVVDGTPYAMNEETAILVNAWQEHCYPHAAAAGETRVLAMYVQPTWLAEVDRDLHLSGHPSFFSRPCVAVPSEVRERAYAIAREISLGGRADGGRIESLILELMTGLARRFSLLAERGGTFRPPPRSCDYRIRKALRLLQESAAGGSLRAEHLFRAAALSRPRFFELFRQQMGLSPAVYANALRMESVLDDVAAPTRPIVDVALNHGFSEQSNFTRFFRKHAGVAPAAYRHSLVGGGGGASSQPVEA
jgi:AraC-like DNA-binding protein